MKNIIDALKIRNIDELDHEIKIRCELIAEMVGTLYPRILQDEISRLNHLKSELILNKPIQKELL